jgi:hypothetical protein
MKKFVFLCLAFLVSGVVNGQTTLEKKYTASATTYAAKETAFGTTQTASTAKSAALSERLYLLDGGYTLGAGFLTDKQKNDYAFNKIAANSAASSADSSLTLAKGQIAAAKVWLSLAAESAKALDFVSANRRMDQALRLVDEATDAAGKASSRAFDGGIEANIMLGIVKDYICCPPDELGDNGNATIQDSADDAYGEATTLASGTSIGWLDTVDSDITDVLYDFSVRQYNVSMSCEDYGTYLDLVAEAVAFQGSIADLTSYVVGSAGWYDYSDGAYSSNYGSEDYESALYWADYMGQCAADVASCNELAAENYTYLADVMADIDALLKTYE